MEVLVDGFSPKDREKMTGRTRTNKVVNLPSKADILYSLQDEDFDRAVGLFSVPARWGRLKSLRIARFLHGGAALAFFLTGWLADLGWLYWGAACLTGLLLLWEHHLITPSDLSRLQHAFFTLNGLVGLLLGLGTLFSVWP